MCKTLTLVIDLGWVSVPAKSQTKYKCPKQTWLIEWNVQYYGSFSFFYLDVKLLKPHGLLEGLDLDLTMPSRQNSVQLWLYKGGIGEVMDTFLLCAKVATSHASHGARQGHSFCPLRPSCSDTPPAGSEWSQLLFALVDFRTCPGHLQKQSHSFTNLEAHGFLIVQLTSLPFWMTLNSLRCLCKDEKLDIFFHPKPLILQLLL